LEEATTLTQMRIACPACAANYDLPDGLLVPGRLVRCARCANKWVPEPQPIAPQPETGAGAAGVGAAGVAPAEEALSAPQRSLLFAPPPVALDEERGERMPGSSFFALARAAAEGADRRRWALFSAAVWLGWAATLVIVGGFGWAVVHWPQEAIRIWPPIGRVLAAAGLAS
jgi:predicted Zn finger-like uncharacterized protein